MQTLEKAHSATSRYAGRPVLTPFCQENTGMEGSVPASALFRAAADHQIGNLPYVFGRLPRSDPHSCKSSGRIAYTGVVKSDIVAESSPGQGAGIRIAVAPWAVAASGGGS